MVCGTVCVHPSIYLSVCLSARCSSVWQVCCCGLLPPPGRRLLQQAWLPFDAYSQQHGAQQHQQMQMLAVSCRKLINNQHFYEDELRHEMSIRVVPLQNWHKPSSAPSTHTDVWILLLSILLPVAMSRLSEFTLLSVRFMIIAPCIKLMPSVL